MLLGKTAVTIASLQKTVLGQTLRKSKLLSWVGYVLDKWPSKYEYHKHILQSNPYSYISFLSVHADVPGPPQPPFDISDIDADACSLSWHIPLEDGGSNVTNYIVEKCDVSRGDWVTALASVTKTSCRVGKLIDHLQSKETLQSAIKSRLIIQEDITFLKGIENQILIL